MSKLATDDQDTLGILNFSVRHDGEKARLRKVVDAGRSIRMTQHAFRREDDEWLAPRTPNLTPQKVKVLRSGGRLADLHVFFTGKLQETLDACAGVLGPLAFVAVGQQQH